MASALYAACRDTETPRNLKDVEQAANIKRKDIARCYRLLVKELDLKMPVTDSVQCVARIASKIGIQEKTKRSAIKVRRTAQEIDEAATVDLKDLKDPEKDSDRTKNPEWLVMVGICTHLGCVPLGNKGEYNGWFCPCHGSHYDTSGRVRKGPAPNNLEIPKYEFVDNNTIKIG